jgi:uncharacterized iron-regulated protein
MRDRHCVCLLLVAGLLASTVSAETRVFDLAIGDPERRERQTPVILDGIADTRRGDVIDPAALAARLEDIRILFVGEDHTNMDFHRVQAQVVRALHHAGREVFIGLEMFPYTRQKQLDRWVRGKLTDAVFLEQSSWYESWGYRWEYYRDIFHFARDNKLRMFGVNAPRSVIKAVRTQDFDGLTPEEAAHLPEEPIDTDNSQHKELFRAYFEDDDALHADLSEEAWEGMFRSQCVWDAVMGWNALQAVQEYGGPDAIIVVLIGAGHVAYGLGAERQIEAQLPNGIASLLPVPIRDPEGNVVDAVRSSYADFVWGVPPFVDPLFPTLGVSLMGAIGDDPSKVIQVSEDSVAERAGIAVGDVLISIDGRAIESTASLRETLAKYEWGDSAEIELSRNDESITITVPFRRRMQETDAG